jgi:hypothetical protein
MSHTLLNRASHILSNCFSVNHFPRNYRFGRAQASKIGRKHKPHREQLVQAKPGRNPNKQNTGREKGKGKGKSRYRKMGQEESRIVDENTPPETLESRTIEAVAKHIKDGRAKRIVVMVSYHHHTESCS